MHTDPTRRVQRCFQWGLGACAALALTAGSAMGQQSQQEQERARQQQMRRQQSMNQDQNQQAGWRSAHNIDKLSKDLVLSGKTKDDRDVHITFSDGRIDSAELDDKNLDHSRIQFNGKDKIRIIEENSDKELLTFKLPQNALSGGMAGNMSDSRFNQNNQNWEQNRQFSETDDPFAYQYQPAPVYRPTWQQDNFQNDQFRSNRYSTNEPSRRWSDDSRMQDSYYESSNYDRDAQMRYREYEPRTRDQWRMEDRANYQTYRTQPDDNNRFDDRSYRTMETQRLYGSAEQRPVVLGIIIDDANQSQIRSSDYDRGLRITQVRQGAAAQTSGLRENDVIVLIEGQPATTQMLERTLARKNTGDTVRFTVIRDGQERDVNVRLSEVSRNDANWDVEIDRNHNIDFWDSEREELEMPNTNHPGPLNIYRPTRPAVPPVRPDENH